MANARTRREFLRDALAVGAAATAVRRAENAAAAEQGGQLPSIKLGELEVSRLILGSNPFFGYSHGNPHASDAEMRAYFTDERIVAVLDRAAEQGITAVWSPCYDRWIRLWTEYQAKGGKLKIWIAQPDQLPMAREIRTAAKNGAKAVCIQGCQVNAHLGQGKFDVVRGWLELIKSFGLPAGMGTHGAKTNLVAEEKGLPTDFYHQTLYRPDNYVREGLEESLATIEKLEKPVVAYKVLGAGRIARRRASLRSQTLEAQRRDLPGDVSEEDRPDCRKCRPHRGNGGDGPGNPQKRLGGTPSSNLDLASRRYFNGHFHAKSLLEDRGHRVGSGNPARPAGQVGCCPRRRRKAARNKGLSGRRLLFSQLPSRRCANERMKGKGWSEWELVKAAPPPFSRSSPAQPAAVGIHGRIRP